MARSCCDWRLTLDESNVGRDSSSFHGNHQVALADLGLEVRPSLAAGKYGKTWHFPRKAPFPTTIRHINTKKTR